MDFGASDMPMTDEAAGRVQDQADSHSHRPRRSSARSSTSPASTTSSSAATCWPTSIWARSPTGTIARIAKDNPGVKLPDQKIIVVHRSDGSGTTFILTDYLSKVSKEWEGGPGKGASPSWPVGVGGKGNEGVAGLVRQLPGAIGYVELIYALQNKISFGEVKNAAGNWVRASIEGVTEAAANVKEIPADYRVSITNAPGADTYPISSFTYLLIPVLAPIPPRARSSRTCSVGSSTPAKAKFRPSPMLRFPRLSRTGA